MVMPVSRVWGATHGAKRAHLIGDIHFAKQGQKSSWIKCDCGWETVGTNHERIERDYWTHRRELGLHAEIMTIGFMPLR
jgi:predicted small metal-binding protein